MFFYSPVSHVGIYIGNGQMVHAPTSGDVVKVASIDAMGGFAGGRRIAALTSLGPLPARPGLSCGASACIEGSGMAQSGTGSWLTVAFLAELAALAALARLGLVAPAARPGSRLLLAVGASRWSPPCSGACSPPRARPVQVPALTVLVKVARLRGARSLALVATGHPWLAAALPLAAAAQLAALDPAGRGPAARADLQQQAPDEGRPHAAGQVDLPPGRHARIHARGARAGR